MMAHYDIFNNLPYEIRLDIFKMSYDSGFLPLSLKDPGQIIEIFSKNGEIYSVLRPPALLHVNSASPNFVLNIYKPWLSQFKGRTEHEPWAETIQTHGLKKASKLQNVCFDLAHDMLFWKSNYPESPYGQFGYIEYQNIRTICVDITEESLDLTTIPNLTKDLCAFKKLNLLRLYETSLTGARGKKVRKITEALVEGKPNSPEPQHMVPEINDEWTEVTFPELPSAWTTYKYTASCLRPKPQREQRTWRRASVIKRKVEMELTSSQPDKGGKRNKGELKEKITRNGLPKAHNGR